MPEQDAGSLSTLTVTVRERTILAHSLTMTAAMLDALDDEVGARDVLELWERVSPDWSL